jgi:hypothetical protein
MIREERRGVARTAREFKKLRKQAEEQGWRIEETKKGYLLHAPDGENHVTTHREPTEAALKMIVSDMKRLGFRQRGR